ncbi:MAG: hypothetical protein FWK04_08625 [Nostoc sp. GBBB01]|nr:hypothetical protein [Nostoc sp. GBBB01]
MVKVRIFYMFDEKDHKDVELSRMPCLGERILIGSLLLEVNRVCHWAEVDEDGIVGDVRALPVEP